MKRKIVFLVTLLCLFSLSFFPVQGQEGAIVLKSEKVQNQFPDGIAFEVVAQTLAPANITEIKLEMRIKGSSRSSYAYLDFTANTTVQGEYVLQTGGAQYKPPGILIEYNFIIRDNAGRSLETPDKTFLYLDNRFEWGKVTEGLIEVYYYGSARERAVLILGATIDTTIRMGDLLGVVPTQTIRVIGYNNYSQMGSALPFQSATTDVELMRLGVAFSDYNVLLELIGEANADSTACHEVTHILVREAAKEAFVNIPAWVDEGLAEYGSPRPDESHEAALAEAISANRLSPLRHLQTYPGTSQEILAFYGQAGSVIRYLIDTYGGDKVRDLFAAFKQGLRIDDALKQVYGFDQNGLDNAWRESIGLPLLEEEPATTPPSTTAPPAATTTPPITTPPGRWSFSCSPAPAR